jgi:lipopolysaccharide/colanic/teichoic acid biosynthesis glycosyltransferase
MARLEKVTGMARETHHPYYDISAPAAIAERNKRRYFRTKWLMDIVLSFVLLMLLSPLLLLIALLIKLESPGPVIFAQERMGYDWRSRRQRRFMFYKFRSMFHNCDQSVHQKHVKDCIRAEKRAGSSSNQGKLEKLTNDGRVTRVGRILRKTSLDELPQLWNVLGGEMSLVGPRPVPLYEVAEYETWHKQRLEATPGITGLWQVKGRGRATLDEMARLDIEYVNRQSLLLDLGILLLTIPAVISGRGSA